MTTAKVLIERDRLTDGSIVYVARDLGLPGCMAHGATPQEAADSLEEARALYLEDDAVAEQPVIAGSNQWVATLTSSRLVGDETMAGR